jgi:5'-3' exonuclease
VTTVPAAFLVDASIYIFRAWFSLPDRWHTDEGWPLNAVYGYSGFLLDLLQDTAPGDYFAAAFDESLGSCFRNEIYPGYKSSRALPDETLAFQLDTCRKITACMGIPVFSGERYEADDYLATLARSLRNDGQPVTLVTRDKDLGQLLLGGGDRWWDAATDSMLDAPGFAGRFGVLPEQFADYLALVGDPVDDIPGVPGVGPKTAALLLQHFGDLEALERGLSEVPGMDIRGAVRLAERLREHWPTVVLARQLAALDDRVPGVVKPKPFALTARALEATADLLQGLGIEGSLPLRYRRLARQVCAA